MLGRLGQRSQLRAVIIGNGERTAGPASVHIFPDNLAIRFDLEESAGVILDNKRISVGNSVFLPDILDDTLWTEF